PATSADTYSLSLHDALPICFVARCWWTRGVMGRFTPTIAAICAAHIPPAFTTSAVRIAPWSVSTAATWPRAVRTMPVTRTPVRRSEEHTSELQSLAYHVCRV